MYIDMVTPELIIITNKNPNQCNFHFPITQVNIILIIKLAATDKTGYL